MNTFVPKQVLKITVDVPAEKQEQFNRLWEQILSDEDAPINKQIHAIQKVREDIQAQGQAALHRLYAISQRDTGQAGVVAHFLAGLYNGRRFPFKLTDLRGLDNAIFEDCMVVLRMDARHCVQEVQEYFEDGGRKWEQMISDWNMDK